MREGEGVRIEGVSGGGAQCLHPSAIYAPHNDRTICAYSCTLLLPDTAESLLW